MKTDKNNAEKKEKGCWKLSKINDKLRNTAEKLRKLAEIAEKLLLFVDQFLNKYRSSFDKFLINFWLQWLYLTVTMQVSPCGYKLWSNLKLALIRISEHLRI